MKLPIELHQVLKQTKYEQSVQASAVKLQI